MSRIIRVDAIIRKVSLIAPFKTSQEVMDQGEERVFVRVQDEDGLFGVGEAATLARFTGETTSTIKCVIDEILAPAIIGKNATDVRAVILSMEKAIPRNHNAKAAVEMAVWDLSGKCLGVPIYQLLGGKLRDSIPIAHVIGLKPLELMAKEAKEAVAKGHTTIKVKLTGEIGNDIAILETIRDAIGPSKSLRADANTAYNIKNAIQAAKVFEEFNLQYLEQPCASNLPGGLKEIREHTNIPIAADESLLSRQDALDLIRTKSIDWLVIKLIKVGGILPALEIATLASLAGIGCTIVSPIETSIGTAAGLHLAAVIPCNFAAHELSGPDYLVKDPTNGYKEIGAEIMLGEAPGLGLSVPDNFYEEV